MAASIAKLYAELNLKNGGFMKGAHEAEAETGRLKKALGSVATTAAGFLAATVIQKGLGLVEGQIGAVIGAASDLHETLNKVDAVFGSNAASVEKWGQSAASSFGLSTQAADEAAASLANLFKGVGVGNDLLPQMSENVVKAAADLGSFDNVDPAQVLADLQSGLVGEAEPLRKYGILLNEANVAQEAVNLGLATSTANVSEAAKVQARYSLILKQVGDAQGDFAKTSGGLANGTRILRAYIQGLQVWLGAKLLPTWTKVIATANRFADRIQKLTSKGVSPLQAVLRSLHVTLDQVFGKQTGGQIYAFVLKLIAGFRQFRKDLPGILMTLKELGVTAVRIVLPPLRLFASLIGFVAKHLDVIGPAILGAVAGLKAFAAAEAIVEAVTAILDVELAPLTLVMIAIAAAAALFAVAYAKNWFHVRDVTNRVVGWIVKQFERFMAILHGGKGLHNAIAGLPGPLQKVAILARRLVILFGDLIHGRWDKVRGDLENIGRTLGNLFKSVGLKNFGQQFKHAFDAVVALFSGVITLVGDLIHGRWGKLWGDFVRIVKDFVGLAIQWFLLNLALWKDALNGLVALFNAIPWGKIWDALKSALSWVVDTGAPLLLGYGKQLIGALWDGATAVWAGSVRPWLHDRIDAIAKALGDWYSAALGWGASLINGIYDSITRLWGNVTGWLSSNLSPAAIAGYLGDWYSSAVSWGASLINGIVNGINSAWQSLVNTIQSVIDEVGKIPKALGISSPSKVATAWGRAVNQGFAKGMGQTLGLVHAAVSDVGAAIGPPATGSPSLAVRASVPAAASIGRGGTRARGPVSIIVNVNGANMTNERVGKVAAAEILRHLDLVGAGQWP